MKLQTKIITDPWFWDKFVNAESQWNLFQNYTWGQLQINLGNTVFRYGFYEKDLLVAAAQIVVIRARRGTFLHVRHGPIIAQKYINDETLWQEIIACLVKTCVEQHAWFIRISPLISDTQESRRLFGMLKLRHSPIHAMDGEVCWILNLEKTENELLANMRKSTRYAIRQAEKLGVTIEESTDISQFMRLYAETAKRQRFVPHKGILKEFELYSKNREAVLLLAKYQNSYIAGAIILFTPFQAIYHHGASISSKIPASYALLFHSIQLAKERGLNIYNFWGIAKSENSRHPWRGITLFKQGFGGYEKGFMHAQDIPVSPFYWLTYAIEWIRKVIKGY